MKKHIYVILPLVLFFLSPAYARTQTDEWMRVQSDNGEFSIEIPRKHNFILDKDGFDITEHNSRNDYQLKNIKLLNAFIDRTLLTFEIYETKKGALKVLYNEDKIRAELSKNSEIKENTFPNGIKEITIKNSEFFISRRFFNSKKYVYVLTALNREGENAVMKRFFDSLKFTPEAVQIDAANGSTLSVLKTSPVEIITENVEPYKPDNSKKPDNPDETKLVLGLKPSPSYVDGARMKGVSGEIRLRCVFSADGFIPRIEFIKMLPEGLNRQVLFAVMRIKFLPKEIKNVPTSSTRMVVYRFSLY